MFAEAARDLASDSAARQRSGAGSPLIVVVTGKVKRHTLRLTRSLTNEKGFVLVQCLEEIDEAVRYCERLAPCVWILEPEDLAKLDASQFSSLVDFGRAIQVLVWVSGGEPASALEPLLRLGCMGFLREDAGASTIRRAVRAAAAGEYWTSRKLTSSLLQRYFAAEGPRKLTKREAEIMQLLSKGYRNREIAQRLFISRETVRWHLRSLYGKVGVQERLGALVPATRPDAKPAAAGRPVKRPLGRQTTPPAPTGEKSG